MVLLANLKISGWEEYSFKANTDIQEGGWFIELEEEMKEDGSLRGQEEEGSETAWQWNQLISQ